jgi:hypothetical protein
LGRLAATVMGRFHRKDPEFILSSALFAPTRAESDAALLDGAERFDLARALRSWLNKEVVDMVPKTNVWKLLLLSVSCRLPTDCVLCEV